MAGFRKEEFRLYKKMARLNKRGLWGEWRIGNVVAGRNKQAPNTLKRRGK